MVMVERPAARPADRFPGRSPLRLASQKLGCRNAEPIRQIEKPLVEQAAFAELDVDQDVARHAREQRQLLLGEPTLLAECANP